MSINVGNFLQKDSKNDGIMQGALIFHFNKFMPTYYRVKHRCSKLSHSAELVYSKRCNNLIKHRKN